MVLLILLIFCSVTIIIDLILILFLSKPVEENINSLESEPFVSVLIAARNEEENIARCVHSLLALNYPKHKLEILIGDDASEDSTLRLIEAYASDHLHIKAVSITRRVSGLKGKANVLAQLAQQAQGAYYFITDADISVPREWITGMLNDIRPDIGIITGVTYISDNNLQNIDWIFALGMVKVVTDMGQPVTTMGNNMLVTQEAYHAVGGYESIPFSITEDFELFKQVRRKGYKVIQKYNADILAASKGIRGWKQLLDQRKRWMAGAIQLPWPIVLLLTSQALYFPALLALLWLHPLVGIYVVVSKVLLQSLFLVILHLRLQLTIRWRYLFVYELYAAMLSVTSSIYYLIPAKISWKGRKY